MSETSIKKGRTGDDLKLWHKVQPLAFSSVVGGGTVLLGKDGRNVGLVHVLNVDWDRRKEFEAAIHRCIATADRYGVALRMIAEGCADPRDFAAKIIAGDASFEVPRSALNDASDEEPLADFKIPLSPGRE